MKGISNKGFEGSLMLPVFGIIALSIAVPIIYAAFTPISTTAVVPNETYSMTTGTFKEFTNYDLIPGSLKLYNATNASVEIPSGIASAADCGTSTGAAITCYYNATVGTKYIKGTFVVNRTGTVNASYSYYPQSYSHNASDQVTAGIVGTLLIAAAIFLIAKYFGMV